MRYFNFLEVTILSMSALFTCSCHNTTDRIKENNVTQTAAKDPVSIADVPDSTVAIQNNNNLDSKSTANKVDTSSNALQENDPDTMLSQVKKLTSMLAGKNEPDILKNFDGGGNMDSMMKKMQSVMGGKSGSPADAIANSLLNLQLQKR